MKVPVKVIRQRDPNDLHPVIVFKTRKEDYGALIDYLTKENIFSFVHNEGWYDTEDREFYIELPTEANKV